MGLFLSWFYAIALLGMAAFGLNIWLFTVSCIVARGLRFAGFAWLLQRYGEPIREFIEKRLGLLAGVAAALVIVLYFAVRYLRA